ncbi:MAG TPA: alpha/beta hydrolase [Thermoanaerobaculia bacterium]|jgi:hypothetical protein
MTVPGYTGSGPGHWQSIWERDDRSMQRVEQRDWNRPDVVEWPASIERAVQSAEQPVVLLAHSCGVTAVALWAREYRTPIAGAFLVAPADPASAAADERVQSFGPVPLVPLPFRALVIASDDDPYCSITRAGEYAAAWGAALVTVEGAGHINTASGHGPWPEGKALLDAFCATLR